MTRTLSVLALSTLLAAPALAQTATDAQQAPAAPEPAAQAAAAPAESGDISGAYVIDPGHSQIVFSYDHLGFSISHGMINGVTGTITLDAANPANSSVEASFPLSSISTIDADLDQHMYGDQMLNGASPDTQVTFRSTSVELEDDDEAKVTGELTLNGVTAPVTLDVDLRKAAAHPMTQKPAVGFVAEGEIKRSDFNLGMLAPAVSDEMELRISVEAIKG
ncbi:YceI family protein [Paracoccus sp. MC1862]|uniref:YceI family protein n=1 Tax=Paracoccus sp. MC1862 TaxID=2760307 RepID=UPI00160243A4|nr:YceI family protein [Paracoccus sp. MC1862]MBB1497289.1 polyisoprenoid-binding protein [Paracoccus sp. MC1862]QQO44745.1 polyisoprenoid-binding protein [Paracoccus sp. MC1862]